MTIGEGGGGGGVHCSRAHFVPGGAESDHGLTRERLLPGLTVCRHGMYTVPFPLEV